jgi:CIC family chloride channel protein
MSKPESVRKKGLDSPAEWEGMGRACLIAILGGVGIGFLGAAFRASLSWVGPHYVALVDAAQRWPWLGWVLPVLLGAIGASLARLLVRPHPVAAGSGVQHVEAIMRGEAEPASFWVVPIKFVGGFLAIGSGLALGREGPTIQMGSALGATLARIFRTSREVMQEVQAALGGAGLAVAFGAPVGGALFVFEEVARTFKLRLVILTLLGVGLAMAVSRWLLGNQSDFQVEPLVSPASLLPAYAIVGLLLGILGVSYNRFIIFCLDLFERMRGLPAEARAALVGGIVGVVGWFGPDWVGGGDNLSQAILLGGVPTLTLLGILLVRWFLGPLSYAAGTPGGLFSPLLLVGASLGALCALGMNSLLPPSAAVSTVSFAVVGMAAFFTGVVRAPLTGAVLIAEMTASQDLIVPLLLASVSAMLSATWLRGEPIYDTLRKRMLARLAESAAPK